MNLRTELHKLRHDMDEIRKSDVELFKTFAKLQEAILNLYADESHYDTLHTHSPMATRPRHINSPIFKNKVILRHFSFTNSIGAKRPLVRRQYSIGPEGRRLRAGSSDSSDDIFDDLEDNLASPTSDCSAYEMIFTLATETMQSFDRLDNVNNSIYEEAFKNSISRWKQNLASAGIGSGDVASDEVTNFLLDERSGNVDQKSLSHINDQKNEAFSDIKQFGCNEHVDIVYSNEPMKNCMCNNPIENIVDNSLHTGLIEPSRGGSVSLGTTDTKPCSFRNEIITVTQL